MIVAGTDSDVSVGRYVSSDAAGCVRVWNSCCEGARGLVYQPLTRDGFVSRFAGASDYQVVNLVARRSGEVAGFASGTVRAGGEQGYITAVMVREETRRRGVGRRLLAGLESALADAAPRIDRYEVMFFNPVTIPWRIPGTDADHPNTPGVDVASDGYLFLKNHGYRDIVYQNSYYLPLSDYRYPADIKRSIERLAEDGLRITRFDRVRHSGLDELFDDLGNEEWREIVTENLARGEAADPVLVVEHDGRICGFTGPTRVQPSGRGYFAGIGVHSDYRNRGAGKALFAGLCMELKDLGASFMTLFTGETNPARGIYEAAGFKIVRTWADMRKPR